MLRKKQQFLLIPFFFLQKLTKLCLPVFISSKNDGKSRFLHKIGKIDKLKKVWKVFAAINELRRTRQTSIDLNKLTNKL